MHISGTDIGAIMGFNPYKAGYDVWRKRKLGIEELVDNKYTEWGLRLENLLAEKYCENWKCKKRKGSQLIKGYYSGTPDFTVRGDDGQKWGLEIKTASVVWDNVPKFYELQCRWYMMLTGLKRWDLAVLANGKDYAEFRFDHCPETERLMLECALDFYTKYMSGDEEPFNPDILQTTDIVKFDDGADLIVEELRKVKDEIVEKNRLKEVLENRLKELIGHDKMVEGDKWRATWSTQSRSTVDYAKLTQTLNVDLEPFKTINTFRVLRLGSK